MEARHYKKLDAKKREADLERSFEDAKRAHDERLAQLQSALELENGTFENNLFNYEVTDFESVCERKGWWTSLHTVQPRAL